MMTRYAGESPFQSNGFVWVNAPGLLMDETGVRYILVKPEFSFAYDAIYCEPTLCHRVLGGDEFALTADEIDEVQGFIDQQLALPQVVSGVDAEGRYFAEVSADEVVRVVSYPPPAGGTWRFDFDRAEQLPGDHWKQAHCVDADGRYLGNVDEGLWTALAGSPPPGVSEGEDWRWDGTSWVDVRPEPDRIAAARERQIENAWGENAIRFIDYSVSVEVGGEMRSYGCDPYTRENILAINGAITRAPHLIPNPRPYTPKGELVPVDTTHDEFLAIYLAGLAAGDAFYTAYKAHKDAINALIDVESIRAYDVTTGWPT